MQALQCLATCIYSVCVFSVVDVFVVFFSTCSQFIGCLRQHAHTGTEVENVHSVHLNAHTKLETVSTRSGHDEFYNINGIQMRMAVDGGQPADEKCASTHSR